MSLFLFIPLFIVAVFLAFYVPGKVLLGEQKNLSKPGLFATSIILGIVLWGWQGYVFGFLHLRFLSYLYLLFFLTVFLKKKYFLFKIPKIQFAKIDWLTMLIASVGIIGQIIPYLRNGQMTSSGLFISNYNSVDHIWHATLVEELVRRFPPNEPGMYGILLTNYHFWFNLVTAELVRVFHLPLFSTQFVGMYALGPIMLALIAYVFVVSIYNSKLFLRLFLFFLYFSGDALGFFMVFLRHRFDLNVGWGFDDATKFMDAPGRGIAVVISLAGLYLLFKNKEQISRKNIFMAGLLFGSLMGFKIYFAIPLILGLFCFAVFKCLKRNFSYFFIFIISSILFLFQFLPFNVSSGGLFFLPFEIPRSFIAQKGLDLGYIDQRWTIYLQHHNYLRLLGYGFLMTAVYLLVQFGVKLFGTVPLKRTIKILGLDFYIFLYSTLISSFILGLFFYQRVGGANIWEFFLTSSLILAIIGSLNIALYLPKKRKLISSVSIILIVIITLPRWINSVNLYLNSDYFSPFHGIYKQELISYDYLKNNTPKDSTVLVIDKKDNTSFSSIVSVLTERNLFLSGEGVGQITTPEYEKRKHDVDLIKTSLNNIQISAVLKRDKLNYVYVYNTFTLPISTMSSSLKEVFSNKSAKIFKVN